MGLEGLEEEEVRVAAPEVLLSIITPIAESRWAGGRDLTGQTGIQAKPGRREPRNPFVCDSAKAKALTAISSKQEVLWLY